VARNDDRRQHLLDAAVRVLARQGARGLTHRAVDREAGVPTGTTSNYFRTHQAIVTALFGRISERLAPDPEVHAALARRRPSRELFAAYVYDIVDRLTADRDVAIALFELRLEATRNEVVAAQLEEWLSSGFAADVAFNEAAGLPGGAREIALFHYAIDGLLLDRLSVPIDPETTPEQVVDALVDALVDPT
jgi:DNA-binding transcriptional regulator YbjK